MSVRNDSPRQTGADVRRLYQVRALLQFGCTLDQVRAGRSARHPPSISH